MSEQNVMAKRQSLFLTQVRRLHFYIGLFIASFIFIAALSGTLYVLAPQIENALYAQLLYTDSVGKDQLLARQVEAAQQVAGPGARLYAVRPAPGPYDTTGRCSVVNDSALRNRAPCLLIRACWK